MAKNAMEKTIAERVELTLAVGRYMRSAERFESASQEYNEACTALRSKLEKPDRFITKIDGLHYLVTCDDAKNFDIEVVAAI